MDADPTMDLIRSLDDAAKWVHQTVVAFVPHEITHSARKQLDGSTVPAQKIKVTENQLRQDAERANERVRKTGRLDTLTIGHRKSDPDFPETQQPPLVGFCRNFRVQWIEREGGRFLGMVYDEYAARDKAALHDLYRQYPFRSAEYHPSVGILGVAALVRPPALDMGTTYVYQANTEEPPPVNPQEFKTMFAECMKTYQADAATAAADEAKKKADEEARTKAATSPPPPALSPPPPPAEVASYAATVADLRKRLDDETAARVKAESTAMLDPLKDLLKFDYARELGTLVGCANADARAAHVKYMAENYMPLPTASGRVTVLAGPAPTSGSDGDPTKAPAKHDQVMNYMRANPGVSYEQAESKITQ